MWGRDGVRSPVDGALNGALALGRREVRDSATDARHGGVPASAKMVSTRQRKIGENVPCVVNLTGVQLDLDNLPALRVAKVGEITSRTSASGTGGGAGQGTRTA